MINLGKQKDKKIEPHIILHLRINQDDIDRYVKNKIQTDPSDIVDNIIAPQPYDADNLSGFTNAFIKEPSPNSLDEKQYEPMSINENEFYELKNNKIINNDDLINNKLSNKESKYISDKNIQIKYSEISKDTGENSNISISDYNLDNVPHINLDKVSNIPEVNVVDDAECSDTKIKLNIAMCEFADANRRNEWIKSTSIWCGWCSHPFAGPPVSIPKWYINKTFFVSGCYCSYSCAAKHLFSRSDVNESDKWNYYNLLHLLRKKIIGLNETTKIELAPPRETLSVFGGYLSIDDFRNITKETNIHHKIYNILEPPMVSIIPNIEEITHKTSNSSDMRLLNTPGGMRSYGNMKYVEPKNESYYSSSKWSNNKSYIPIDKERMDRAVENLKVRRTAPLLDKKKTLLHYMNLKINRKA